MVFDDWLCLYRLRIEPTVRSTERRLVLAPRETRNALTLCVWLWLDLCCRASRTSGFRRVVMTVRVAFRQLSTVAGRGQKSGRTAPMINYVRTVIIRTSRNGYEFVMSVI